MRVVVTGAAGMLGADLVERAPRHPRVGSVLGLTRVDLDVTSPARVRAVLEDQARAAEDLVVVNAAAWTDVDGAETHEAEAFAVNATGAAHVAAACAGLGARLIHVSTDYVFAGDAGDPYDEDAPTAPGTAYGRTKRAGEEAVLALHPLGASVVRTAWLYGARGPSFVRTMARLEAERETVTVVDDQVGSPTWSADLADALLELATSAVGPGVLHATSSGSTTWCGLARAVFEELGADPARVLACTTADYPRPAARPAYSVLSGRAWEAAGLTPIRPWRAALAAAFAEQRQALIGGTPG